MSDAIFYILLLASFLGIPVGLCLGILLIFPKKYKLAATSVVIPLVLCPLLFLSLVLMPELSDARYGTYKAFYRNIDVGMDRAEVLELLDEYYPLYGPRQKPILLENSEERLDFFMNPESSTEPNCEGIFLEMQDGKVIHKTYSPD